MPYMRGEGLANFSTTMRPAPDPPTLCMPILGYPSRNEVTSVFSVRRLDPILGWDPTRRARMRRQGKGTTTRRVRRTAGDQIAACANNKHSNSVKIVIEGKTRGLR